MTTHRHGTHQAFTAIEAPYLNGWVFNIGETPNGTPVVGFQVVATAAEPDVLVVEFDPRRLRALALDLLNAAEDLDIVLMNKTREVKA